MTLSRALAAAALACSLGVAVAQPVKKLEVTWTEEVGALVRFLGVEVGPPSGGQRKVTLSYRVLRACKTFSLAGHSVARDGGKLGRFELAKARANTGLEQRFDDAATVVYADGHQLIVDQVSCQ